MRLFYYSDSVECPLIQMLEMYFRIQVQERQPLLSAKLMFGDHK